MQLASERYDRLLLCSIESQLLSKYVMASVSLPSIYPGTNSQGHGSPLVSQEQ